MRLSLRRPAVGYLSATRHPWPCLIFLLPLLLTYEIGVFWLGGARPESLRNGADTWVRWGLEAFGLPSLYGAPVLILAIFFAWSCVRQYDRPEGVLRTVFGMALESVLFAAGLWWLSRHFGPWLRQLGWPLSLALSPRAMGRIVTYVGAGIYEEALFRLGLLFLLQSFVRVLGIPRFIAFPINTLAAAALFSAAHHIGPYGEAFDLHVFVFRFLAGLYFTLLYQLRGFGIAVGAHAGYDVLAGVLFKGR